MFWIYFDILCIYMKFVMLIIVYLKPIDVLRYFRKTEFQDIRWNAFISALIKPIKLILASIKTFILDTYVDKNCSP